MKTPLVIGMLATALLAFAPTATAVDCTSLNPGTPSDGLVGTTEWAAFSAAYQTCQAANAVQVSATTNGGAAEAKILGVAGGALGLLNTAGLGPAATVFEGAAFAVSGSETHDACGAAAGDTNPACGSDPAVSQTQACASNVAVPNPIGGGLGGNTLSNSNGALQATCALANVAVASVPSTTAVTTYAGAAEAALLDSTDDLFAIGSDAIDASCQLVFGTVPCF